MKAREIEGYLRAMGFEKGIVYCITAISEMNGVQQKQLMDMAAQLDQMSDIVSNFATISEEMNKNVKRMQAMLPEDDLPHVTK